MGEVDKELKKFGSELKEVFEVRHMKETILSCRTMEQLETCKEWVNRAKKKYNAFYRGFITGVINTCEHYMRGKDE